MDKEAKVYKIGRSEDNDIVIPHNSISRYHAEVFVDPEKNVFYTDLNTSFGSFLNGEKTTESIVLSKGDKLVLGDGQKINWEILMQNRLNLKDVVEITEEAHTENISFIQHHWDILLIYGLIVIVLLFLNVII